MQRYVNDLVWLIMRLMVKITDLSLEIDRKVFHKPMIMHGKRPSEIVFHLCHHYLTSHGDDVWKRIDKLIEGD